MARALNSYKSSVYENMSSGSSPGFFVLSFPYLLYYRLQSCTTTNIYEIPCADTSKRIISSMGDKGWGDGSDILGAGGFRVSNALNKIPLIGNLANMILGNIGINYMPWWNAESGAKTVEPQVELKFDLFNDSAEAAMRNFIFVNTIVPNNRWLQYGMFQHSSNLYDVKIEGLNRLFACSASMNVTYEGVLRDPHVTWLHALKAHFNKNMDAEKFF